MNRATPASEILPVTGFPLPWKCTEWNRSCFIVEIEGSARRFIVYYEADASHAAQTNRMTRDEALDFALALAEGVTSDAWEP